MKQPRRSVTRIMFLGCGVFWIVSGAVAAEDLPWADSLVADGGDDWRARAVLELANHETRAIEGEAFQVTVGRGQGQVDLVDARAETVRVCDALGRELLFDLSDARGAARRRGRLAAGDRLSFCIECAAATSSGDKVVPGRVRYVVYFDNPAATAPVEHLGAELTNGGFEVGGEAPDGWQPYGADDTRHVSWVDECPHTGRHCGRVTVKAGAAPTWVKWLQSDILVSAGARYRLTAWVRAKDIRGRAGWYVHVHGDKPMVVNRVANAGEGTYDWKRIMIEFSTPPGSKSAAVGTLLYGTGTAWYDDASLERLDQGPGPKLVSAAVERRDLAEIAGRSDWLLPREQWTHRVAIVVSNTTQHAEPNVCVSINLGRQIHQVSRRGGSVKAAVMDPSRSGPTSAAQALPCFRLGHNRAFVTTLPPRCRKTFHAYLAPVDEPAGADEKAGTMTLLGSGANLVRNGDFESGDVMPEAWSPDARWTKTGKPQRKFARVTGGIVGEHCARLDVLPGAPLAWSGWRQGPIPVKPGATYLYAGWLKSRGVSDGTVTLHGHFHAADGKLAKGAPYFSTHPSLSGDRDWTLSRGLVRTPADCASVILHLTMNAHGTVWHDGIVLCRAVESRTRHLETAVAPTAAKARPLHVWRVNPLVKVFRDDPPGEPVTSLHVDAAANEYEPIQLVVRGDRPMKGVRVEVTPLKGADRSLPPVQVDRVGYVPVDCPSSYYQSRLPGWYRLVPRGTARTDGWAGDWPDPLPPCRPFDLPVGQNQPIWLTAYVPPGTPAGDYRGAVTINTDGGPTVRLPLTVRVWPFELPARPSLRVIYDLRRGRGESPFGDGSIGELRKWYELLARHRVSPGLLPSPTFKYEGGKVEMDTRMFDEAAHICIDELKMNVFYSPHLFYAFGWAYKPRPLFGHEAFTDEYKRAFKACYRAFLDHVKRHGWYDELVNYISDEPHYSHKHVVEQMKQVCDLAHSVDPNVPLYSSTWRHVPAWNGYLDLWGVGQYGCFPVEEMKRRQADGETLWFTTDGQQALDTPYLATERLLPYYCFKYDVKGYEFWGVSWWTYDPWDRGWHEFISQSPDGENRYWVRYPNGDGYLTYPGRRVGLDRPVSSIRLEQVREGVEDYEYLRLLQDLIERVRAKHPDAHLAAAVAHTHPRVRAAKAIRDGQAALDRARALVTIPNAGGVRSTEILPDPGAVPTVRRAVAEQIVKLRALLGQ